METQLCDLMDTMAIDDVEPCGPVAEPNHRRQGDKDNLWACCFFLDNQDQ
jgi:hypothetical protein